MEAPPRAPDPVPGRVELGGVTLPTPWCGLYEKVPEGVMDEGMPIVLQQYARLAEHFGYELLVSVRSGAPVSMPGMMDTILNVGMTAEAVQEWSDRIGLRAALDSRRRLIQMLGATAYGVPADRFETVLTAVKVEAGVSEDKDLNPLHLQKVIKQFLDAFQKFTGHVFPETVSEQLRCSVPWSGGAFAREQEDALWQLVFTAQPERSRVFEPSSKRRKNAPEPSPPATA
ncbi:MAG: hypothetical protein K2X11_00495 [Acetobacteraceae bacterium]|nr:hypothetical protein [Acetobacteraceae bacterium]